MHPSFPLGRRQFLTGATAAASALAIPALAQQPWPQKTVRWIVPYGAGGASDIVARVIGEPLGHALGQRVLVDNKPGAGGTVGMANLASSPPDGYSLCTADNGGLFNNWFLFPKLSYTPDSFEYVTMTGRFPLVLVANASRVPAKTYEELAQWLRTSPDVSYATPGVGSPHHIAMTMMEERVGARWQHVPYKGDAAAIVDIISGQVPFMLVGVASARPYLQDPRMRFFGVAWPQRLTSMPDVPTFDEIGIKDFDMAAEQGVLVPAGTPKEIVLRLNQEIAKVLSVQSVRDKMETVGMYPTPPQSPDDFRAYVDRQRKVYGDLIRRKGITIT